MSLGGRRMGNERQEAEKCDFQNLTPSELLASLELRYATADWRKDRSIFNGPRPPTSTTMPSESKAQRRNLNTCITKLKLLNSFLQQTRTHEVSTRIKLHDDGCT